MKALGVGTLGSRKEVVHSHPDAFVGLFQNGVHDLDLERSEISHHQDEMVGGANRELQTSEWYKYSSGTATCSSLRSTLEMILCTLSIELSRTSSISSLNMSTRYSSARDAKCRDRRLNSQMESTAAILTFGEGEL